MGQMYYKTSSGALVPITGATTDTSKVSLTGTDTISGAKTFTGTVTLPSGSVTAANIKGEAWTSYTPTVTASGSATSGWTQTGYYIQAGKLVTARFEVTAPGSNLGTGYYRIALPVTAASTYPASGVLIGVCRFNDAGAASYFGFASILASATYLTIVYAGTNPALANSVGATSPFQFGSGDLINGQITYEAA